MTRKSFYVTFDSQSPLAPFYTIVEADTQRDAAIYADTHWFPYVYRVYSSGQFNYHKKQGNYRLLPNENKTVRNNYHGHKQSVHHSI